LADGYRLQLDDGGSLECDLAVLADGGRSGLREQLGIAVRQHDYRQSALLANISPARAHAGEAFERFTSDGPLALLPMADNRCTLIWSRAPDDAERLAALPDADFLAELQAAFGYRLGALQRVGSRQLYPLARIEACEQVRAHLVLLGNAAHSLHPVAGQGFNLSLRDARSLADGLLESPAAPGALATLLAYQARQQQDQALTVGLSDRLPLLFGRGERWLTAARGLGLLALDLLPPARHGFARQAMGLGSRTL
ncbi:TPA: FAD-dependent monooxygenase, partial [Klebsiella pneumoniae]